MDRTETDAGEMRTPPPAPRGARARARAELTGEILAAAHRRLAQEGPTQLSVRAVARDLGMASSAVYRYFPSRDELLTALLIRAYDALGDAVEAADAALPRTPLDRRWREFAQTVRAWARAQPQDWALLFGSPVPGYAAPASTVGPATRVTGVLAQLLRDTARSAPPAGPHPDQAPGAGESDAFRLSVRALRGFLEGAEPTPVGDALLVRGMSAWSGLVGAVSLELFGHLRGAVTDFDVYLDHLLRSLDPTV